MKPQMTHRPLIRVVSISLVAVAVLAATTLICAGGKQQTEATPNDQKASHSDADHARYEATLKKTMTGRVEIYFDVAELEAESPRMADMKFVDLVDVTGKHLLRFAGTDGNMWLVDPDTVLTYRIRQAKKADE